MSQGSTRSTSTERMQKRRPSGVLKPPIACRAFLSSFDHTSAQDLHSLWSCLAPAMYELGCVPGSHSGNRVATPAALLGRDPPRYTLGSFLRTLARPNRPVEQISMALEQPRTHIKSGAPPFPLHSIPARASTCLNSDPVASLDMTLQRALLTA